MSKSTFKPTEEESASIWKNRTASESASIWKNRILDEHALGVAGHEGFGRGVGIIGQQDGGLVVPEVGDEELPELSFAWDGFLLEDARLAVFAVGDVDLDGAPSRRRQLLDLGEEAGRTPPQGHEDDAVAVEPVEAIVSGELWNRRRGASAACHVAASRT